MTSLKDEMTSKDSDSQEQLQGEGLGEETNSAIDRILRRDERAQALGLSDDQPNIFDGDQQDLLDRAALARVPGLS
jgi:hypothetical protein